MIEQIPEWIQGSWILKLAWVPLVGLVPGLIAKWANKEKLWAIWKPILTVGMKTLSLFLRAKLGTKAERALENGFLGTICYLLEMTGKHAKEVLLSDNKKKAKKKGA